MFRAIATFWAGSRNRSTGKFTHKPPRFFAQIEFLEKRDTPAVLYPDYLFGSPTGGANPLSSAGPSGLTPAQVRHAYGFDQIRFANGTIAGDGAGMTIAIVDAYDNPKIASDLHQFNLAFGLPDSGFTKINQTGGTTYPAVDAGWAGEIALDVEWAHAMAPKANILLVEATDSSYENMFAAVAFAAKQPGVVAVSMSFGGSEYAGQTAFDSVFKTPAGHKGVTFVASSGDNGAPVSYPASSPNVLSVGGTRITLSTSNTISAETGWSGSGGGISSVEPLPAYQKGVVPATTTRRANPDVSYNADPMSGVAVYDTVNNPASAPWYVLGGTSAGAPQLAAMVAIADQGRTLAGLPTLDGATQTLPAIYAMASSNFRDVTLGKSTGSPNYSAVAGYDFVTGRGSPIAQNFVATLSGQTVTPPPVNPPPVTPPPVITPVVSSLGVSISQSSVTAGSSFQVTVRALDSTGAVVPGYTGTVAFASSDISAVLPARYTFTATDKGVHTFTVTLKTAGSQRVSVVDVGAGIQGSGNTTVNAAAPASILFEQQPQSAVVGATISPTVRVRVVDAYGNLVRTDNSDVITITLGANPGSAVLSGTTSVTVSQGIASFVDLSLDKIGVGYTLVVSSGALARATSAQFSILAKPAARTLVDFESAATWNIVGARNPTAKRDLSAAHDGANGLIDSNGNDWIYRTDSATSVKAGETISTWLRFAGSADGRAYFGFGAGAYGTYSLVAAPNTGELQIQLNAFYGNRVLTTVPQDFQADHWYRLEVVWGTDGKIVGNLYDSDGATLIQSVSAVNRWITAGGIAFRATGSDKHWDTVTDTPTNVSALPNVRGRNRTHDVYHHTAVVAGQLDTDEAAKKAKIQQQALATIRDHLFLAGFHRKGF